MITRVLAGAMVVSSLAAPAVAEENKGYWSLYYQQIKVHRMQIDTGEIDIGTVDTQSLNFELAYRIGTRTTLHFGIPLVRKRYQGPGPHRPDLIDPPKPDKFIDDGSYHMAFQDFLLGVSYRVLDGDQWLVEPFVYYGLPSHDYPHFGHAAVGQNLWRVEFGTRLVYRPPFSDFYFRLDPSYVFVEETLGVNINHWRAFFETGYFFGRGMVGRAFVMTKQGNGLGFPGDFQDTDTTSEKWFQHDRLVKHSYTNAGLGFDFYLGSKNRVGAAVFRTIQADVVHKADWVLNVGISRAF
jgi:hypothetical protein